MAEEIRAWLSLVSLVLAVGGIIYTWITARAKNNSSEILAIKEAQKHHDRRIQNIESELKHLPGKDEVHKLNIAVTEMRGTISTIGNQISTANLSMARIENYILQKEKDKE